jgi:flagellar protein FliS
MANNQGANHYKQMSIKTASRGQLLIMLYEAAITNVKKASVCIQNQDISGKGLYIGKTHDIINELASSLDHESGGNIAADLERLYNFIVEQLVKANIENKVDHLNTVQKLLETLLDGWRGAVDQVQKGMAK